MNERTLQKDEIDDLRGFARNFSVIDEGEVLWAACKFAILAKGDLEQIKNLLVSASHALPKKAWKDAVQDVIVDADWWRVKPEMTTA